MGCVTTRPAVAASMDRSYQADFDMSNPLQTQILGERVKMGQVAPKKKQEPRNAAFQTAYDTQAYDQWKNMQNGRVHPSQPASDRPPSVLLGRLSKGAPAEDKKSLKISQ